MPTGLALAGSSVPNQTSSLLDQQAFRPHAVIVRVNVLDRDRPAVGGTRREARRRMRTFLFSQVPAWPSSAVCDFEALPQQMRGPLHDRGHSAANGALSDRTTIEVHYPSRDYL